ncbi:MAG: hypothetical protein ACOVOR_02320 [Rhabdochlamydiaceae bacterium]
MNSFNFEIKNHLYPHMIESYFNENTEMYPSFTIEEGLKTTLILALALSAIQITRAFYISPKVNSLLTHPKILKPFSACFLKHFVNIYTQRFLFCSPFIISSDWFKEGQSREDTVVSIFLLSFIPLFGWASWSMMRPYERHLLKLFFQPNVSILSAHLSIYLFRSYASKENFKMLKHLILPYNLLCNLLTLNVDRLKNQIHQIPFHLAFGGYNRLLKWTLPLKSSKFIHVDLIFCAILGRHSETVKFLMELSPLRENYLTNSQNYIKVPTQLNSIRKLSLFELIADLEDKNLLQFIFQKYKMNQALPAFLKRSILNGQNTAILEIIKQIQSLEDVEFRELERLVLQICKDDLIPYFFKLESSDQKELLNTLRENGLGLEIEDLFADEKTKRIYLLFEENLLSANKAEIQKLLKIPFVLKTLKGLDLALFMFQGPQSTAIQIAKNDSELVEILLQHGFEDYDDSPDV